jgi:glyoxylate/hydroxypyruvate reductase
MMSSSSASSAGERLKVLVTRSNIAPASRELLEKEAQRLNVEIDWWDSGDGEKPLPREELLKRVRAGVDGIFCILEDKIDAEVLEAAGKRLKVVSTHSVGVDHIDVAECKKRGVAIG